MTGGCVSPHCSVAMSPVPTPHPDPPSVSLPLTLSNTQYGVQTPAREGEFEYFSGIDCPIMFHEQTSKPKCSEEEVMKGDLDSHYLMKVHV